MSFNIYVWKCKYITYAAVNALKIHQFEMFCLVNCLLQDGCDVNAARKLTATSWCCPLFLTGAVMKYWVLRKIEYHHIFRFLLMCGLTTVLPVFGLGVEDQ